MNAWQLPSLGSIENLKLVRDLPEPKPAAGEVLLRVEFAALNPADRYLAEKQYPANPPLPHVLGRDGVGTVVSVGEGVANAKPGDVKAILRGETGVSRAGTLATHVTVGADSLVDVPSGWTREQAAAAPLVYLTAVQALTQWPDLPAKATVLITGATGGVGVASVQLAKAMGHTVVGVSRSAEKAKQLYDLGADFTIHPDSIKASGSLVKDKDMGETPMPRIDLVIENIGGPAFTLLPGLLSPHGRISVIGQLAGPVPDFKPALLFFKRLKIGGVFVGSYSREEAHAAWKTAVGLLAKTGQRPVIDRVFGFDEVPNAFARLKEGPMGKVLVSAK